MGSLTILMTKKIKGIINNVSNKINTATLHPVIKYLSTFLPQPNALQL